MSKPLGNEVLVITLCPTKIHQNAHKQIGDLCEEGVLVQLGTTDFPLNRDMLKDKIKDASALICLSKDLIDKEIIDCAPKLRIIANYGAGYDSIDVKYATEKGIYVTNTPDVVSEATSDLAILLLLSCCRKSSDAERYARNGMWGPNTHLEQFIGVNPRGKTLGIIGMGKIGTLTARKALAFGLNIIYFNRHKVLDEIESELNARRVNLDELLATSDFISIHTPLNSETTHLLDRKEFGKMKRGCFLINTARGAIINEDALVEAIKNGIVKGAGLDVFEREPKIHAGLLELPNITVLPHIGTCTEETRGAMWSLCIENVARVLHKQPPLTPVNNVKL